jgi:hypothetical protein
VRSQEIRRQEAQAALDADAAIVVYATHRDEVTRQRAAQLAESAAAKDAVKQRNIDTMRDSLIQVAPPASSLHAPAHTISLLLHI